MTKYAAQIVFTQADEHRWVGKLLNPAAIDMQRGGAQALPTVRCVITERDGHCHMTIQGGPAGSRRYSVHANVSRAQEAAIRWAGRRFKIAVEGKR